MPCACHNKCFGSLTLSNTLYVDTPQNRQINHKISENRRDLGIPLTRETPSRHITGFV